MSRALATSSRARVAPRWGARRGAFLSDKRRFRSFREPKSVVGSAQTVSWVLALKARILGPKVFSDAIGSMAKSATTEKGAIRAAFWPPFLRRGSEQCEPGRV